MLTHERLPALAALPNLAHLTLHHTAWQVTLAFLITKKLSIVRAIMYWIAQMGGAIIGSFLVKYVRCSCLACSVPQLKPCLHASPMSTASS